MIPTIDILILSNGPGEITTWVRPVVRSLRQQLGTKIRISLVLSPCTHATGNELEIAASYPEIDRMQSATDFLPFLIWGKTAANWDWSQQGIVLFLGGDQFSALVIGKHLGYRTVIYAEWEARWYRYIDRFAVMNQSVIDKLPPKYQPKCTIIGDLMADVGNYEWQYSPNASQIIGILPGSKAAKLSQGVPLGIAIAHLLHQYNPQIQFQIFVAPTLDVSTLAKYADPKQNPIIAKFDPNLTAQLIINPENDQPAYLETNQGLQIPLITTFPAYQFFSQCALCLTTAGANTAELASLSVPMIVLLPIQELDAMRSWDGIPGILANLPLIGTIFAKIINLFMSKLKRLYAWPNIWAKQEIVPELFEVIKPEKVAQMIINFLNHPELLIEMSNKMRNIRGNKGAAAKITQIVVEELTNLSNKN